MYFLHILQIFILGKYFLIAIVTIVSQLIKTLYKNNYPIKLTHQLQYIMQTYYVKLKGFYVPTQNQILVFSLPKLVMANDLLRHLQVPELKILDH